MAFHAAFWRPAMVLPMLAVAAAQPASAVSSRVKSACAGDYFTHCSAHAPESPGVRGCMRAVGPRLSGGCLAALAAEGQISKAEIAKHGGGKAKPVVANAAGTANAAKIEPKPAKAAAKEKAAGKDKLARSSGGKGASKTVDKPVKVAAKDPELRAKTANLAVEKNELPAKTGSQASGNGARPGPSDAAPGKRPKAATRSERAPAAKRVKNQNTVAAIAPPTAKLRNALPARAYATASSWDDRPVARRAPAPVRAPAVTASADDAGYGYARPPRATVSPSNADVSGWTGF